MPSIRKAFIGASFETFSCGVATVISIVNKGKIVVRFANTGTEVECFSSNLHKGEVKDPCRRSCLGVGYIGVGPYKAKQNRIQTDEYKRWTHMMRRCYGDQSGKNSCYIGVTVCSEWHNFQNFASWYNAHIPDKLNRYELDKDALSNGVKIYSPSTCTFLTKQRNVEVSHAKIWLFVSPGGDRVEIYNLKKFCEENDLLDCKMSMVNSGKRKTHKGWTKADTIKLNG